MPTSSNRPQIQKSLPDRFWKKMRWMFPTPSSPSSSAPPAAPPRGHTVRTAALQSGAAVLTAAGEIFSGCNVENASYGLTICAERNAVFQAVCRGTRAAFDPRAVVVYTPTAAPTAPCGACRQVINEFGADAKVISVCDGPGVIESSIEILLPLAFGPANLNK